MNKKGGGRERYREREIRERQQSVNKWLKRRLGEGGRCTCTIRSSPILKSG